jgi:hypothetical protein
MRVRQRSQHVPGSRGPNGAGARGRDASHKGRSRTSKNAGQRNRNRRHGQGRDNAGFWGDPSRLPSARTDVRMTDHPAAVPQSLGPPPLPGHESIAEHYFGVVYDRAVATAGALAAAGGLIDPDALAEERAN